MERRVHNHGQKPSPEETKPEKYYEKRQKGTKEDR
jgi:hypothetical protein